MDRVTAKSQNANFNFDFIFIVKNILRLWQLQQQLEQGRKLPFDKVFNCATGDVQFEKPITFIQQIIAMCSCPELLKSENFPEDAKRRATKLLNAFNGLNSAENTLQLLRDDVATFLERRDNLPAETENIIIISSAIEGVRMILKALNATFSGEHASILYPIPQCPSFRMTISEYMYQVGYYLEEDDDWSVSISHLKEMLERAKLRSEPRAIVIVNTGNPTGQVLARNKMEEIIRFTYNEGLFLIADEADQWSCYDDNFPFISFKKVITQMEAPYNTVQCAAIYSIPKCYVGQLSPQGGFVEIINVDPVIRKDLSTSASLTGKNSTLSLPVAISAATNVPQYGEPSYPKFHVLQQQANHMCASLNDIPGFTCCQARSGWYAYVRLHLPGKFLEFADLENEEPDVLYAMQLLENTGVSVVPGRAFGQRPNTYHIGLNILVATDRRTELIELLRGFQLEFLDLYK